MTKICLAALGVCALVLFMTGSAAPAAAPQLQAGVKLAQVDYDAAPAVADWNNDGKKDLLVGKFTNGQILLFLNQGAPTAPSFGPSTPIASGGAPIAVGYG